MGYYVDTYDVNIFIKKEDFDAIYKRMCELNDHDELKRGGSYGGNNDKQDGDRYSRNKWFSWMDWNYPETCSNLPEILGQIGFEIYYEDGNIVGLSYSSKTGNEDYFLACFAGFVPDGSYIAFRGEEQEHNYRYYYADNKCFYQVAKVIIDFSGYEEEMVVGQMTDADKAHAIWLEEWRKKNSEIKTL